MVHREEQPGDRDAVACLQFFGTGYGAEAPSIYFQRAQCAADTIRLWLEKSLTAASGDGAAGRHLTEVVRLTSNAEGVKYLLSALDALSDREFFQGMAYTKLWYLYDLGKLLR